MTANQHQSLRKPSDRVGTLAHAALPPPELPASDEEQRLLRGLRDRDAAAFESLLDRYYSPMLHLARSYVRSREDAEEVVQDTWLTVLAGLDRFEGRSSLKTWIFRILVNRARTRATREARMVPFSALETVPSSEPAGGGERASDPARLPGGPQARYWPGQAWVPPDPEEKLLSEELFAKIEKAVEELPSRQREVITLRGIEGWTAEEVCELLDVSEGNQRVLLHRARLMVRDAVANYLDSAGTPRIADAAGSAL